jgi:hypothetical protein
MRRLSVFLVVFFVVLASFACGGSPSNPSGTGTLNVRLTDSPFSAAGAVLVTFKEVRAHRSDSDWAPVPFADTTATTRTCDLKKLENGAADILGSGPLVTGHYTMIRLVVESAKIYQAKSPAGPACASSITIAGEEGINVQIPSGEVKLNRGFTLEADATTTIELDFDGDRSIRETGNGVYMMNPVIAILSVTPATPPQP